MKNFECTWYWAKCILFHTKKTNVCFGSTSIFFAKNMNLWQLVTRLRNKYTKELDIYRETLDTHSDKYNISSRDETSNNVGKFYSSPNRCCVNNSGDQRAWSFRRFLNRLRDRQPSSIPIYSAIFRNCFSIRASLRRKRALLRYRRTSAFITVTYYFLYSRFTL